MVRHLLRLLTIGRTLARHDALFLMEELPVARQVAWVARLAARRNVPGRPGQRLATALIELGPSFIKFGQALSIRPDLVGDDVAEDLTGLQDRLPPVPGTVARATVEESLGQPLDQIFRSFDDTAVAAASIAQVHFAETLEGEPVAVKVLRPEVEATIRRDLNLAYWLARWIETLNPAWRRLRPMETVATIDRSVTMELDLRFEAAACEEMGDNFAEDTDFRVPRVDWLRTGQRVLTLERIQGLPIDEPETLRAHGHDPDRLVQVAAEVFFNMVFRDGFFHADLHPGNMFVEDDGTLVAVDFGITGRLERRNRRYLGEMLLAFLNRDYRTVAEVHFRAGLVPADQSVEMFTQACRSIAEPIMGRPLAEISVARLLGHLFQVTETFGMETQPHLLLLQKSMLVTEGVGRLLKPDVNMWMLARPLIERWMRTHLGPEARLRDGVQQVAEGLAHFPELAANAQKAAEMIRRDGLRLEPQTVRALTEDGRRREVGMTRLLWIVVLLLALLVVVEVWG